MIQYHTSDFHTNLRFLDITDFRKIEKSPNVGLGRCVL